MKNNNFVENFKSIHFIGIGGISMSALAKLMLAQGKKVTGSDTIKSKITDEIMHLGITFFDSHKAKNVIGADLVVFTSAISSDNKELMMAKKLGIPLMERAEFLGLIAKKYKNIIAVSGSHGKTTTCGMLASVFIEAGLNPTVHMGGQTDILNGNLKIGDNEYFITEACEYKNNFLKTKHTVGVILNIENDHTDYFKDINQIYNSFSEFYNISKDVNIINEKYISLLNKNNNNYISFSFNRGNYIAKNIALNNEAHTMFTVYYKGKNLGRFKITSPLKHNVYNALATIAVANYFNIPINKIKLGLKNFTGIKRRFELVNKVNNAIVIHDYAHHPTEIATTIDECHKLFKKPIICVFQPHTYTRTLALMTEFLKSFEVCSKIIIAKTYAAREKPIKEGEAKTLCKNLKIDGKDAIYFNSFKKIKKYLLKTVKCDQIVLILGAGDIEKLAYEYL